MTYLKHDVNKFFVILVLFLLFVGIGSLLFFQSKIENLSQTKQNHTQQLNDMTAYIVEETSLKQSLEGNLNKSMQDKRALEEQFHAIETEKDTLRRVLAEKETQLQNISFYYEQIKSQLADKEATNIILSRRNNEMQETLEDNIKQISALSIEKDNFCKKEKMQENIDEFCQNE